MSYKARGTEHLQAGTGGLREVQHNEGDERKAQRNALQHATIT